MSTDLFRIKNVHPTPLKIDKLELWFTWLQDEHHMPSWFLSTVDPTLGMERQIDILWLSLILPKLSITPEYVPTWMGNVMHIARIYEQGIDLMDDAVARNMDVADFSGLFPDIMSSEDYTQIAREIILHYKSYIDFRKTHGLPAAAFGESHWLEKWMTNWKTWYGDLPIHFFDILPSVFIQRQQYHLHQEYNPDHISPTTLQVLWSSGILDAALEVEQSDTLDTIINAGKSALQRMQTHTGLSHGEIQMKLHFFFETKLQKDASVLRPWLWGHTPLLVAID